MKKITIVLTALIIGAFAFQGCEDMDDNAVPVNDFIWKGLNLYYLWQPDVPQLADDAFATQGDLNNYLESFSSPETLFESLLYQRGTVDKFSVLVPDFNVLEGLLQGVSKSNGMEFGLKYIEAGGSGIFGFVRYVMPGSDAEAKGIQRGDIFYAVNGVSLTDSNYRALLGEDTYTLNLADYANGVLSPNGEQVTLTKAQYAENPVLTTNVFNMGGRTIGYIMYNGFYSNYNNDINNAFGQLAAQNVNELVLDLRYNGGGSVATATYLASMITGQFNGQLLAKEQWNPRLQEHFESTSPASLVNNFTSEMRNPDNSTATINHLNLSRVYILTTESTASASELVINCLTPYIQVTTIGTKTLGKNVGSVTLYDSPDFTKNDLDPSHRYAMQPIVLKIVNKLGFGDYQNGIAPSIELPEDYGNMGILGDPEEPLLATALGQIIGSGRMRARVPERIHRNFKDSKNMVPFGNEMYIEELPQGLNHMIKNLQ